VTVTDSRPSFLSEPVESGEDRVHRVGARPRHFLERVEVVLRRGRVRLPRVRLDDLDIRAVRQ
jgi:hypothetical protein